MRSVLILILGIGALASIALCGSYGWDQATELKDRVTQAFVYGFVALATLALHAVALHICVNGWRKSGVFVGIVAMLAFMMTAFTSLGGLASRSDKVIAERQSELDAKADVKSQIDALVAERSSMKFTRTTKAAVEAAQLLAETRKQARIAECGNGDPKQRGRFCRDKEGAEGEAVTALATAQTNKASTDRFEQIETELKRLRSLKTDGTVGVADPIRALLATIVSAWADLLTAWQKAVFAVIYDLTLVAFMIGIEVMGHLRLSKQEAIAVTEAETPMATAAPTAAPEHAPAPAAPPPEPTPTPVAKTKPRAPERPRPKLAAATAKPIELLLDWLLECCEFETGPRTEIYDGYVNHAAWCQRRGLRAMSPEAFVEDLNRVCSEHGSERWLCLDGDHMVGVRLIAHAAEASVT